MILYGYSCVNDPPAILLSHRTFDASSRNIRLVDSPFVKRSTGVADFAHVLREALFTAMLLEARAR
jgi:hypothetical protein